MSNYDFSTLSYLDFERLACDLLNDYIKDKYQNSRFKSFKQGKDKGIDLLLSTFGNEYEVVGQVKHYYKTPFSKLKYDLIHFEKEKVLKLNPKSYVFVTSSELSPQNKIVIKEIFEPYIISLDDIFGREDLNALIRGNKYLEEKHYKLWFSSTIILNKILNYKYEGRKNEFTEEVLKRKLRLFVVTRNFYDAKNVIKKNNFIILTGEPGVGKSTLSDMLIYNYIKDGFQLNIIYDSIKEIEDTLKSDASKQVFYFDDFLGHTQFLEESERLRNFDPLRAESRIELLAYSYGVKRRMLDNHISESELTEDQKTIITNLASFICSHNNFTPRIIEFFTGSKITKLSPENYKNFILNNLENPKEIWSHAYTFQISNYDRFLLNTLFSLKGQARKEILELSYNNRLDYEVKSNNYVKPLNSFDESLRKLNDGFIIVNNYNPIHISFINPSLEDFLKFYISDNDLEIKRILFSSKFIKQWYYFFDPYIVKKGDFPIDLSDFFVLNCSKFVQNDSRDEDLYFISIFIHYFIKKPPIKLLVTFLAKIKNFQFLIADKFIQFYSKKFLNYAKSNPSLNELISNFNWKYFFISVINEEFLDDVTELIQLFVRHYAINFKDLIKQHQIESNELVVSLYEHLELIFHEELETQYKYLNENTEQNTHQEIINKIEENVDFIKVNMFGDFNIDLTYLKKADWNSIAISNKIDRPQSNRSTLINNDNIDEYIDMYMDYYDEYELEYEDYYRNENLKPTANDVIDDHDDLPF